MYTNLNEKSLVVAGTSTLFVADICMYVRPIAPGPGTM